MDLPEGLLELLNQPSHCYVATVMADGSPQLTQTWVDTDGKHILINSVQGFQKLKNIARDARVAVTVADHTRPAHYYWVRGRVIDVTTQGGAEHIDKLSRRYLGRDYPWFGGRDQIRVIITIEAEKISTTG